MHKTKRDEKILIGILIFAAAVTLGPVFLSLLRAQTDDGQVKGHRTSSRSGAKLWLETSSEPSSQTVIHGAVGFTFASFHISTPNSTEDVKITEFEITHRVSKRNTQNGLANVAFYDGSTLLTPMLQPEPVRRTRNTLTYRFSNPIIIPKGSFKILTLRADIVHGAAGQKHSLSCGSRTCLTAVGVESNQPVRPRIVRNRRATMTIVSTGTFRLYRDAGNPRDGNVFRNSSKVPVLQMLLNAQNEPLDLRSIHFEISPYRRGTLTDEIAQVYLFDGSTLIAQGTPTTTRKITFEGIPLRIDPNSRGKTLTVKVDVAATADPGQGMSFRVNEDAYDLVGVDSGSLVGRKEKKGRVRGNRFIVR